MSVSRKRLFQVLAFHLRRSTKPPRLRAVGDFLALTQALGTNLVRRGGLEPLKVQTIDREAPQRWQETMSIGKVRFLGLMLLLAFVDVAEAQASDTQTMGSGSVQIFAVTNPLDTVECVNPPGPCGPLVSLPIDVKSNSLLSVTFSARGSVAPSTENTIVAVDCDVDGQQCQPYSGPVEFLYPQFCCDTRSFTWVTAAAKGPHTVHINWTTLNSGTGLIGSRTLQVQALPIVK
jgi:hypothetical protein